MRKTASATSILRILATSALLGALVPGVALADDSVMVLGITSLEGDDDFARNFTGAIRHEASQVDGWQVSGREVTLTQMSLAHGCSDTPDVTCLGEIASTLNAQRLVYGMVRREGADALHVTLSVYNAESNEIERTVEETLPSRRTDIDDLRGPARSVMARLAGPLTGSLAVTSNTPGATVRIDDEVAGTTDSDGNFSMPSVTVGPHRVQVTADGREPWTGEVTIAQNTELTLDADLPEGTGDTGGGGGEINWAAIALIAGGAAAFGVSIYSWARLQAINSDPQYVGYTEAFRNAYDPTRPMGVPPATVVSNCGAAASGDTFGGRVMDSQASTVSDLCSEGDTLEILQYVFLGIAVAAGATGAVLLILDAGGGGESDEPQVTITPNFGPDGATLGARVRF